MVALADRVQGNTEVGLTIDPGLHQRSQVCRHPDTQRGLRRNCRQHDTIDVGAHAAPGSAGLGPARADSMNIDRPLRVSLIHIKPGGGGENDCLGRNRRQVETQQRALNHACLGTDM